jgi:hypothetical protein
MAGAGIDERFWALYRKSRCWKARWFVKTCPWERFLVALGNDSESILGN